MSRLTGTSSGDLLLDFAGVVGTVAERNLMVGRVDSVDSGGQLRQVEAAARAEDSVAAARLLREIDLEVPEIEAKMRQIIG